MPSDCPQQPLFRKTQSLLGFLLELMAAFLHFFKLQEVKNFCLKVRLTGSVVSGGDFGQIPVIVSLHLQVEDLRLCIRSLGYQILVQ